jgi:hypothetical protein
MVFPQRLPQQIPGGWVELEKAGHGVELLLGHLERVKTFNSHINAPFRLMIYECLPELAGSTKIE